MTTFKNSKADVLSSQVNGISAATFSTTAGSVTQVFTVPGATTDKHVFVQVQTCAVAGCIVERSEITAADEVTVEFLADPGNGTVVTVLLFSTQI